MSDKTGRSLTKLERKPTKVQPALDNICQGADQTWDYRARTPTKPTKVTKLEQKATKVQSA